MKRNLTIILVVIIVLLLFGGGFWFWRSRKAKEPLPTQVPKGVLVETSLEERPFISLTPSSDGHWLTVEVSRIKDAESLEYELLYNTASGATQGSINTVKLNGKSSYSKKILLGSESSGHYKFDEGVTQGSLTIRLRGEKGTRKFVTDFHLQQGDKELTSIDGNFGLESKLSPGNFYLTMSTVGLPEKFEGKVVSGPYGVFTAGRELIRNGKVTFTLSEEIPSAKLYTWTGRSWEEVEDLEIEGKEISVGIDNLGVFIAASQE